MGKLVFKKTAKDLAFDMLEIMDSDGYENFYMAFFAIGMGIEDRLDEPNVNEALREIYKYYMDTDSISSFLNEDLVTRFNMLNSNSIEEDWEVE